MRNRLVLACLLATCSTAFAQDPRWADLGSSRGDELLESYFRRQTRSLTEQSLKDIRSLEDWTSRREEYHRQLREMLGLDPWPDRTPLDTQITGRVDHEEFTVEKLHFQSRPGLYVSGNLYLPKNASGPAPAVLYVCGHGRVKIDGVSYGNKTHYQHHGAWYARHGYVCLVIDTLQLGEIEGFHHGTHNLGMWWWNARGYTPAGVEAWNCVRALDYLQSRKEVDPERLGVAGRSGGGAYSWWIAALDERIKAAVPVAGIVPLDSHVVQGCVEGHCDCMFMLNTYRWDYPMVAALVAPRALLLTNSDKDRIFPLEGVVDLHREVRNIYRLYGADDKFGLQISEGPHKDTQELQMAEFRWFQRFLQQDDSLVRVAAEPLFEPRELKVFESLPADQQNTRIHETFVPAAECSVPKDSAEWQRMRAGWMAALRDKCFRGWPQATVPLGVREAYRAESDGIELAAYDFTSQPDVPLRLWIVQRAELEKPALAVLTVLDAQEWNAWLETMTAGFAESMRCERDEAMRPNEDEYRSLAEMLKKQPWAFAYVAPRGIGPTEWNQDPKRETHIRRRFMLLGQTADGMRVWDTRRAIQALRAVPAVEAAPLWLQGHRDMAGVALYASLFEPDVVRLDLWHLPPSHREGPNLLNVMRYLDVPQTVAMAAENSRVVLYEKDADATWPYAPDVVKQLGWDAKHLQIRRDPATDQPATAK